MQNNNSLAKISLAINALLVIAVIILFARGNGSGEGDIADAIQDDSTTQQVIKPNDGDLKIGYFVTDSLNTQLLRVKDMENDMAAAQKQAEQDMQSEQAKIDRWNKKWEDKMPLLTSEQEVYQREMQQMQMDAMNAEQRIQMQLAQKQEEIMFGHIKRIHNSCKIYAEKNGFDMIMSYQIGQNPIYIHPSMDVTAGVIKLMNDEYRSMHSSTGVEEEEENAQ